MQYRAGSAEEGDEVGADRLTAELGLEDLDRPQGLDRLAEQPGRELVRVAFGEGLEQVVDVHRSGSST